MDHLHANHLHLCLEAAAHAYAARQQPQALAALLASHACTLPAKSNDHEHVNHLFANHLHLCLHAARHAYSAEQHAQASAALLASHACTLPARRGDHEQVDHLFAEQKQMLICTTICKRNSTSIIAYDHSVKFSWKRGPTKTSLPALCKESLDIHAKLLCRSSIELLYRISFCVQNISYVCMYAQIKVPACATKLMVITILLQKQQQHT